MTLAQWIEAHRLNPIDHPRGCKAVPIGPGEAGYRELWHLDDWFVSSVTGGAVWLCRR